MRWQRETRRQAGQSGEQVGSVERGRIAGRNTAARQAASSAAKLNGVRVATGVDAERTPSGSRSPISSSLATWFGGFLMIQFGDPAEGDRITVVQNWFEELRRLVPTN